LVRAETIAANPPAVCTASASSRPRPTRIADYPLSARGSRLRWKDGRFELEWVMSDQASAPTTSAAAPARMVMDPRVMLAPFVGCVNSVTQRACRRTAPIASGSHGRKALVVLPSHRARLNRFLVRLALLSLLSGAAEARVASGLVPTTRVSVMTRLPPRSVRTRNEIAAFA
jgi:hypothetical protein